MRRTCWALPVSVLALVVVTRWDVTWSVNQSPSDDDQHADVGRVRILRRNWLTANQPTPKWLWWQNTTCLPVLRTEYQCSSPATLGNRSSAAPSTQSPISIAFLQDFANSHVAPSEFPLSRHHPLRPLTSWSRILLLPSKAFPTPPSPPEPCTTKSSKIQNSMLQEMPHLASRNLFSYVHFADCSCMCLWQRSYGRTQSPISFDNTSIPLLAKTQSSQVSQGSGISTQTNYATSRQVKSPAYLFPPRSHNFDGNSPLPLLAPRQPRLPQQPSSSAARTRRAQLRKSWERRFAKVSVSSLSAVEHVMWAIVILFPQCWLTLRAQNWASCWQRKAMERATVC